MQRRWGLVLTCICLVGCGELVPAEGRVTLDGEPLEAAQVAFIPAEKSKGSGTQHLGGGLTDKEGRFRLETINKTGLARGLYKVTVSKKVLPPGVPYPEKGEDWGRVRHQWRESLPFCYQDPQKTPISIEISGGSTDLHVDLQSTAK